MFIYVFFIFTVMVIFIVFENKIILSFNLSLETDLCTNLLIHVLIVKRCLTKFHHTKYIHLRNLKIRSRQHIRGRLYLMYFYFYYRYASGTTPWGNPNAIGFEPQRHDDGHLEVIGFTYSSLVRKLSNFGRKHKKK